MYLARKSSSTQKGPYFKDIEEKLDGLVALLAPPDSSNRDSSTARNPIQNPINGTVSPACADHEASFVSDERTPSDTGHISLQNHQQFPLSHARDNSLTRSDKPESYHANESSSKGISTPRSAIIPDTSVHRDVNDGLVDEARADELLDKFRTMSTFFPFVVISQKLRAQDLRSRKPMLFLAIVMTATTDDRKLQMHCEERFRREIATKVIVHSHRSLDCLQSILVYLAWYAVPLNVKLALIHWIRYHFHFTTQNQQIYILLQIAIGMAIELGTSHRSRKPVIDISANKNLSSVAPEIVREAQRSFLGSYFLSSWYIFLLEIPHKLSLTKSSITAGMSKPSLMQFSSETLECCNSLARSREFASDSSIIDLISLTHIGDEIRASFGSEEHEKLCVEELKVQMLLKALREKLNGWEIKASQPSPMREDYVSSAESSSYMGTASSLTVAKTLSFPFYEMELYLLGSQARAGDAALSATGISLPDVLTRCFEACKSFLDNFLDIPTDHYRFLSFVEWMRLPYVILKVCCFCFPSDNFAQIGWNTCMARERVRIDLYLDSLCNRLQLLTTFNPPTQPKPDFFCSIKVIMEKTRQWYLQMISVLNGGPAPAEESPLEVLRDPHEPEQDSMVHNPEDQLEGVAKPFDPRFETDQQGPSEFFFPSLPGFGGSSDPFEGLDDSFWTSNIFDTEMFAEA
ncbi:hypothetical protein ACLMJK_002543 [Lecanora helva]